MVEYHPITARGIRNLEKCMTAFYGMFNSLCMLPWHPLPDAVRLPTSLSLSIILVGPSHNWAEIIPQRLRTVRLVENALHYTFHGISGEFRNATKAAGPLWSAVQAEAPTSAAAAAAAAADAAGGGQ
jgi:hypothetical protein